MGFSDIHRISQIHSKLNESEGVNQVGHLLIFYH